MLNPKLRYEIGDLFHYRGKTYILAQVEHEHVALIDLETGNRWRHPAHVNHVHYILPDDLPAIFGYTLNHGDNDPYQWGTWTWEAEMQRRHPGHED